MFNIRREREREKCIIFIVYWEVGQQVRLGGCRLGFRVGLSLDWICTLFSAYSCAIGVGIIGYTFPEDSCIVCLL